MQKQRAPNWNYSGERMLSNCMLRDLMLNVTMNDS
jgi:hypothetical protein